MANTGYKVYQTLERYWTDTGELEGTTKSNVDTDPDYVAPVYDTTMCPIPEPPTFTGTPSSDLIYQYTLRVAWSANDDGQIVAYDFHFRVQGGTWQTTTGLSSGTFYKDNSVDVGNTYEFYVTAHDDDGMSTDSAIGNYTVTDITNPTVSNFRVTGYDHDTIVVAWDASDNEGVTSQRVYYKTSSSSTWSYASVSGADRTTSINGLSAETTYDLYVRAYDGAGNYTDSTTISQTTDSDTSTISNVSTTSLYFWYDGLAAESFDFDCDGDWTITTSASWLQVAKSGELMATSTSGGAGTDIAINADAGDNTGNEYSRTGYIYIRNSDGSQTETITCTQDADPNAGGGGGGFDDGL